MFCLDVTAYRNQLDFVVRAGWDRDQSRQALGLHRRSADDVGIAANRQTVRCPRQIAFLHLQGDDVGRLFGFENPFPAHVSGCRESLMIAFIPAGKLKESYAIFGHFYSIQLARQVVVECRSVLEIIAFDQLPKKPAKIGARKPDAVFIMMNPGSSRPLVEVNDCIEYERLHELIVSLVPTHPDTTQYQLMRVMHHCGWKHVRVLNLSDLRCTKSPEFFRRFKHLEQECLCDGHSIFSTDRRAELAAKWTRDQSVPVIRAWGVSPHLDPLIIRCISQLHPHRTVGGLQKELTTNKFLHPLPSLQSQQRQWVERMIAQCYQEGWHTAECRTKRQ
jgi:hypothetical protein